MKKQILTSALLVASMSLSAQKSASIKIYADQGKEIIPKEIYGLVLTTPWSPWFHKSA